MANIYFSQLALNIATSLLGHQESQTILKQALVVFYLTSYCAYILYGENNKFNIHSSDELVVDISFKRDFLDRSINLFYTNQYDKLYQVIVGYLENFSGPQLKTAKVESVSHLN